MTSQPVPRLIRSSFALLLLAVRTPMASAVPIVPAMINDQ